MACIRAICRNCGRAARRQAPDEDVCHTRGPMLADAPPLSLWEANQRKVGPVLEQALLHGSPAHRGRAKFEFREEGADERGAQQAEDLGASSVASGDPSFISSGGADEAMPRGARRGPARQGRGLRRPEDVSTCSGTSQATPAASASFASVRQEEEEAHSAVSQATSFESCGEVGQEASLESISASSWGTPCNGASHAEGAELPARASWWGEASFSSVRGLEKAPAISRVIGGKVVQHPRIAAGLEPWSLGQSQELYKELGVRDPRRSYLALWLNVGHASMLAVAEVVDTARFDECFAALGSCMNQRMKLLLQPAQSRLPLPTKGPKEAQTIGEFWGRSASLTRSKPGDGAPDLVVVQADLFCKWFMKQALVRFGFRKDGAVDVILVDWPGQAVLLSVRLSGTEELRQQVF